VVGKGAKVYETNKSLQHPANTAKETGSAAWAALTVRVAGAAAAAAAPTMEATDGPAVTLAAQRSAARIGK
jgi:hypothetical protein